MSYYCVNIYLSSNFLGITFYVQIDLFKHFREDVSLRLWNSDFKRQIDGIELLQKVGSWSQYYLISLLEWFNIVCSCEFSCFDAVATVQALPSSGKEVIELLDILFRWFVLRFCESNTTCLLKVNAKHSCQESCWPYFFLLRHNKLICFLYCVLLSLVGPWLSSWAFWYSKRPVLHVDRSWSCNFSSLPHREGMISTKVHIGCVIIFHITIMTKLLLFCSLVITLKKSGKKWGSW